jgi:hypothetical protein
MMKVQEELNTLKARANESELKAKQEQKIRNLESQINKYKNDCSNIMRYVNMQKQLIADYTLRKRELREDEEFLEYASAQTRMEKAKVKVDITQEHAKCEQQSFLNLSVVREIHSLQHQLMQASETNGLSL